jgi:3-hydroxyisobutyrate dehydrogenase-like beta-hydroxyacid dehydrogenase
MNQQTGQSKFNPTTRPTTAVIGAGTLGSRIALMLASSGGEARLYDAKARLGLKTGKGFYSDYGQKAPAVA